MEFGSSRAIKHECSFDKFETRAFGIRSEKERMGDEAEENEGCFFFFWEGAKIERRRDRRVFA